MAGGIDWFRWHHGSVTDPKFQLVARKAGASLPDVLAVWAYMLEQASASEHRGEFEIDAEAVDCMFGFPNTETRTADILKAMGDRGLTEGNRIASWAKRQPKREDDTAAERKRRQRERDHEALLAAAVTAEASRDVTQGHADVTHGHDRGEESREDTEEGAGGTFPARTHVAESVPENTGPPPSAAAQVCTAIRLAGFAEDTRPGDALLLSLIAQGATADEFAAAAARAVKGGKGWGWILAAVQGRRSDAAATALAPKAAPVATVAENPEVARTAAYLEEQRRLSIETQGSRKVWLERRAKQQQQGAA